MALRVNYNYQADYGHVNLKRTEHKLNTSLERLSTGYRINSARDDAAGLFIADQLKLVNEALGQGSRNANDGVSAAQIAEASLSQIYDKLLTMYTKASQAASDTNDSNSRLSLKRDVQKLVDAIDKIAKAAEFNGIDLLQGDFTNKKIHYGPRADQTLSISIDSATAADLGAYTIEGNGQVNAAAAGSSYLTIVTGNYHYSSGEDRVEINSVSLEGGSYLATGAVDAYGLAEEINHNTTLQNQGIEATATNRSVAGATFSDVSVGTGIVLKFFVAESTSAAFTVSYVNGDTITLSDLVDKINSNADNNYITASEDNNKLVLEATGGRTIGIEVNTDEASSVQIDLNTLVNGSSATVGGTSASEGTKVGAAIAVGDLTVLGEDSYSYAFSGISSASAGLGVAICVHSPVLITFQRSAMTKARQSLPKLGKRKNNRVY